MDVGPDRFYYVLYLTVGQLTKFDWEDAEEAEEEQPRPKRRRKANNPFIDSEAGVDGDASGDESDRSDDMDSFIDDSDI